TLSASRPRGGRGHGGAGRGVAGQPERLRASASRSLPARRFAGGPFERCRAAARPSTGGQSDWGRSVPRRAGPLVARFPRRAAPPAPAAAAVVDPNYWTVIVPVMLYVGGRWILQWKG